MTPDLLQPLDLVVPSIRAVEYHLARVESERDLLARLLTLAREYDQRRHQVRCHDSTPSGQEATHAS